MVGRYLQWSWSSSPWLTRATWRRRALGRAAGGANEARGLMKARWMIAVCERLRLVAECRSR